MILNATLCDYLRVTTYEPEDFKLLLHLFKLHQKRTDAKKETASMMQYDGWKAGSAFLGAGPQKRGQHYLMHVSGSPAHLFWNDLKESEFLDLGATRLDVQLTIDLPQAYSAPSLFDALEGKVPYGRSVMLYRSGQGMDTVYLGKLTTKHGRVTRIYVKEHSEGLALRFETQFNGVWANEHFGYLLNGGTMESLLVAELESMGNIDFEPLSTFYKLLNGSLPAPKPKPVETSSPTLDWLLNTCEPVIIRMMNDHDHGSKVRRWLYDLLDNNGW